MISPSKEKFVNIVKDGKIPPLYMEIPYVYPCLLYEKLASENSILLESIKGPWNLARYSFVGFDPYQIIKVKNSLISMQLPGKEISGFSHSNDNSGILSPLEVLKSLVNAYSQLPIEDLPPFQGGAAGILSYDFVQYLERVPRSAVDDLNLPDAHFLIIDKLIAFDHMKKQAWIMVCPGLRNNIRSGIDWQEEYDKSEQDLHKIAETVSGSITSKDFRELGNNERTEIVYEMKMEDYMDIVKRAKEYIATGDIFQSNLSHRVSAYIGEKRPWAIYRKLSSVNPAPFAAFLDFGEYQIASSSPERLIRVSQGVIDTRPIAGTRPRGRDQAEDALMRSELLLNEKERAEHIMLIDLERNDLGRVSRYGSVVVDEFMTTEDYSHVIHIVSNVTGRLSDGKDCFDAIQAAFPGGTITGVPKVRCMEIIDELEPVCRGPYTGAIGYISFSGDMDLNIVIRSFVIKKGMAYVQAGAGIVADSDPEREYYEALKKAEALIRTLEDI